jgi:sigma-E factor negative regulatory protein RseC
MITTAKVVETKGNIAIVEAERKSACSGCHKNADGNSCTACSLLGGDKTIRATAKNTVGAKIGDLVEIESSSSKMVLYAFLIFILPLVVAVVAYVIAISLEQSEGVGLLCSAIGFVFMIAVDAVISKAIGKNTYDINIVKIIR